MRKKSGKSWFGTLVTSILFFIILVVLSRGTANLSGSADQEGVTATHQAIERAAVLCYATEGFYPPGLNYIEENYGVQIDRTRYAVRYEVFASNIMPTIRVAQR